MLQGSSILRGSHEAILVRLKDFSQTNIFGKNGNTITGVYTTKDALDLESEATAYHYFRRYAVQEINGN